MFYGKSQVISGKGIRSQNKVKSHIADIAPTLYAWLGMSIPAEEDGQPIRKVFAEEVEIQKQRECHFPSSYEQGRTTTDICDVEQAALEEQFKNLGYL